MPRAVMSLARPFRLAIAAAIALAVALGLAWPQSEARVPTTASTLDLARGAPASGPITVIGIEAPPLWTTSARPTVTVRLRNTTHKRTTAVVWWLLNDRGLTQPWISPRQFSRSVDVTLPADGELGVPIPATAECKAAGYFTLSAWVHTRASKTQTVPSDGVGVASDITIAKSQPDLTETHEDDSPFLVTAVRLPATAQAGRRLTVMATVANDALRPATARVRLRLTPLDGGNVLSGSPVDLIIDEAALRDVPITVPELPQPGRYTVVAEVSLLWPDGSARVVDTATAGAALEVSASSATG